eukprot:10592243-Alexandrium_andersonii.AAC.1
MRVPEDEEPVPLPLPLPELVDAGGAALVLLLNLFVLRYGGWYAPRISTYTVHGDSELSFGLSQFGIILEPVAFKNCSRPEWQDASDSCDVSGHY